MKKKEDTKRVKSMMKRNRVKVAVALDLRKHIRESTVLFSDYL